MKIVTRHFLSTDSNQAVTPLVQLVTAGPLAAINSTGSFFSVNPCRNQERFRLAAASCETCLQENYSSFLLASNLIQGDIAADSSSSALDRMIVVEIIKDINAHTSFPGMQFICSPYKHISHSSIAFLPLRSFLIVQLLHVPFLHCRNPTNSDPLRSPTAFFLTIFTFFPLNQKREPFL